MAVVDLSKYPAEELNAIKEQLRPTVLVEVTESIKKETEIDIAKLKDEMRMKNDIAIKQAVKEWQDKQAAERKPLTQDQIQTLLNQEYVEFTIKVRKADSESETVDLVLRELPQSKEEEFYKLAKDFVKDNIAAVGGGTFKLQEGDLFEKVGAMMDMFDPAFTVMAKACALCLNPYGRHQWLTPDWVKNNLNSFRIMNIIKAQSEVNKLRDFFSSLFQAFQTAEPTNPVDVQL